MKCANCDEIALYVYQGSGIRETAYCVSCLPKFLRAQAKAGVLPTTAAFAEIKGRLEAQGQTEVAEEPKRPAAKKVKSEGQTEEA